MIPVDITYTDCDVSPALNALIEKKVQSLERVSSRIHHCRVTVSVFHGRDRAKMFQVQMQLALPGAELVVNKKMEGHRGEQVFLLAREVFKAAKRQLIEYTHRHEEFRYKMAD